MRIQDYYAEKFGFDAVRDKASHGAAQGASSSFLDTLMAGGQTAGTQAAAEAANAGQASAAPRLETGNAPVRVVDVEAEFGLALTNDMSPEAAEKRAQLLERLDKLCADNPGVYYRLNPAIFQKMADDADFEKTIYQAVDAFEEATVKALASSDRAVSAMYMGADGDYVILTGRRPEEDLENEESLWDVIIARMRKAADTREELRDIFPGMPQGMADLVWQHLTQQDAEVA